LDGQFVTLSAADLGPATRSFLQKPNHSANAQSAVLPKTIIRTRCSPICAGFNCTH
jgi:hypothetical protein